MVEANVLTKDGSSSEYSDSLLIERNLYADIIFRTIADGIVVADSTGRIIDANNASYVMFGYPQGSLVGQTIETLVPEGERGRHHCRIAEFDRPDSAIMGRGREINALRSNGENFPIEVIITTFRKEDCTFFIAVMRDISDRRKKYEKIIDQSNRDHLTGLYNRRFFEEFISQALYRSRTDVNPLSVIIADIDNFKSYNDHYGHVAGDNCLRMIANVAINSVGRKTDCVARYGGEEIIFVLPATGEAGLRVVCERFVTSVRNQCIEHRFSHTADVVTVSLGAITIDHQFQGTQADIVNMADQCLYKAKADGKNRAVIL